MSCAIIYIYIYKKCFSSIYHHSPIPNKKQIIYYPLIIFFPLINLSIRFNLIQILWFNYIFSLNSTSQISNWFLLFLHSCIIIANEFPQSAYLWWTICEFNGNYNLRSKWLHIITQPKYELWKWWLLNSFRSMYHMYMYMI